MSDQNTQVSIRLSVEDHATERLKSIKQMADELAKTFKQLGMSKLPADPSGKTKAPTGRDAVASFDRSANAARRAAAIDTGASRQRRADARAEAGERQAFDRADVAALRSKMGFESRMRRQRAAEEATIERQRRTVELATMRDLRGKLDFATRMHRQRQTETKEAERAETAAARARIENERRVQRERDRSRQQAFTHGRQAWSRGREAVREITRPPAAVAAAGAAGAVAGTRRVLRAESDVDSAEIGTRQYGGLDAKAARTLRDTWASPLAESLGVETPKLLTAWTDAVKLGIPTAGAAAVAELTTKTSEAWGVAFESVSDVLGTVNTLLTAKGGAFDFDKLKSVANTLQHLAAKQSTTPEKMISFLKRGAGGADVLGMSMESALAFGSASTSLGNQAGQSGSLLDYVASRIVEMPRLTKGHGDQAKQAKQLIGALGYGSAQAMDAKRRQNPDAFLPDLLERFNKIKDPKKQDQAIRFFTGREWLGEFGRMVKGIDTYREAVKLSKEAKGLDAIGAVWELHRLKLAFVFKQFRSGWLNILGEFGKVLSPMARQAGDYFLEWTVKLRAGGLQARFRAAIEGFIEGLGFRDFPALLRGILGTPGEGMAGTVESWRAFARGFGEGIRNVANTIKGVFRILTGGDMRPETVGKLAAEILGFSAALVIAGPAVSVLTGLATGILAIAMAARGAMAIISALKLTPAAPGPGAAPGAVAGGGFLAWFRNLMRLAPAVAMPLTTDASKADQDRMMQRLGDWAQGQRRDGRSTWQDPPARVQRQSSTGDWHGHIVPAAFSSMGDLAQSVTRLERVVSGDRARLQLASFTNSTASALGRATSVGGGGAALGQGSPRTSSDGWVGPRLKVPSWFGGGGAGGGSASSNPANSAASAAMLDAIAGTESGKAGYDAVLGNGKYGTPSKPVSTMTLDEAFAFGRQVKARHGSSSALGRYQIVGNTMRSAQAAMGIPGSATFDPAMQDRMARWIARNQGLGAWEGLKGNPRAMAAAQAALAQGGAKDVPTGAGVGGTAGFSGDVGGRIAELQKTGAIANQQCVSLVKAFSGSAASVLSWRKGEAAEAGNLKPGTPIATFLNRDGSQSSRYAGGGTGTPGAGLDHAAVFKSYVRDNAGKIIGMSVAEQFAGSGGVRDKVYRFGQGRGEHNGSNYSAVLGQDGQPLGNRNPMRAATIAAATASEAARKATTLADGAQAAVDGFTSTGWHRQIRNAFGGVDALKGDSAPGATANEWTPNAGDRRTIPLPPRRPDALASGVPLPPKRPTAADLAAGADVGPRAVRVQGADGATGAGGGTTVHAPVTINAAQQTPNEIAGAMQRHVAQARSWRAHDMEPELT